MRKYLTGLCGAVALAAAASLSAQSPAEAQGRCVNCAKAPITKMSTRYKFTTVNRVVNVTRFKDVNRTRYQRHVTRVVHVRRVQPIQRVHFVTRVHNRTVIVRQAQHTAKTVMMPARTVSAGHRLIHINYPPRFGHCCR